MDTQIQLQYNQLILDNNRHRGGVGIDQFLGTKYRLLFLGGKSNNSDHKGMGVGGAKKGQIPINISNPDGVSI